jgi:hypothetical protein
LTGRSPHGRVPGSPSIHGHDQSTATAFAHQRRTFTLERFVGLSDQSGTRMTLHAGRRRHEKGFIFPRGTRTEIS